MGASAAPRPVPGRSCCSVNKLYLELESQNQEPVLSPEGHPSSLRALGAGRRVSPQGLRYSYAALGPLLWGLLMSPPPLHGNSPMATWDPLPVGFLGVGNLGLTAVPVA